MSQASMGPNFTVRVLLISENSRYVKDMVRFLPASYPWRYAALASGDLSFNLKNMSTCHYERLELWVKVLQVHSSPRYRFWRGESSEDGPSRVPGASEAFVKIQFNFEICSFEFIECSDLLNQFSLSSSATSFTHQTRHSLVVCANTARSILVRVVAQVLIEILSTLSRTKRIERIISRLSKLIILLFQLLRDHCGRLGEALLVDLQSPDCHVTQCVLQTHSHIVGLPVSSIPSGELLC